MFHLKCFRIFCFFFGDFTGLRVRVFHSLPFFKVYKRAIKIANAFADLMGKDPLNNCPILEDKETEPEVKILWFLLSDFIGAMQIKRDTLGGGTVSPK